MDDIEAMDRIVSVLIGAVGFGILQCIGVIGLIILSQ